MRARDDSLGTSLKQLLGGLYRPPIEVLVSPPLANQWVADSTVDAVVFGKAFIANPEFVECFQQDVPLTLQRKAIRITQD